MKWMGRIGWDGVMVRLSGLRRTILFFWIWGVRLCCCMQDTKIYNISHLTILWKDIIQELHNRVCRITTLGRVEYSIYPNPTYQHPLVYIGKKAMIRITYLATANSSYSTWDFLQYTGGMSYAMWDKRCYIGDTVHEGKIYYIEIKKIQQLQMICSLKFNLFKT